MPIGTARRIRPRVPYSYYCSPRESMCSYGRFMESGLPARCKTIHYRMTSDPAARVAHYGALWWSRVPAPLSLLRPRALPDSGVLRLRAKMREAWEDWRRGEGTAMMTLSHQRTREKLFAARKITGDRADKPRSLIEILIFLCWMMQ